MKEMWSRSWKKVLIWACGYVSIIAFAIAGGYAIVKGEDEELRRAAKYCFVVTLLFLAADAVVSILSRVLSLSYSSGFSLALQWINFFLLLAKIAVYATAIVMALVNGKNASSAGVQKESAADGKAASEEKAPAAAAAEADEKTSPSASEQSEQSASDGETSAE